MAKIGDKKRLYKPSTGDYTALTMFKATPVFLFAHGSTMMLGEESEPAEIWREVGNEALRRGIKHIVMMVSLF
jgi:aromatic ring-opening dioxygenase catalytic subunit (LigB family)